jgi:hypothetical protein
VSEGGEILRPDGAYRFHDPAKAPDPERPYHLLIRQLPAGTDPDAVQESTHGWSASPVQKFERLLRQNKIPVGLLVTPTALRLVYAPVGENTGSLTFPLDCILSNAGRPAAEALRTVLGRQRLEIAPAEQRLLPVLQRSRAYQNSVSTELAKQVLSALYELVRGFQAADESAHGAVLREVRERDPDEVYHGLLTLLLRLIVLLFAEDRGLMPSSPLYQRHYGAHGLFEQLRADHERHSATMDRRAVIPNSVSRPGADISLIPTVSRFWKDAPPLKHPRWICRSLPTARSTGCCANFSFSKANAFPTGTSMSNRSARCMRPSWGSVSSCPPNSPPL